ncbi:MAG: glycosyltransferase family 2 protein [Bryobacteraceae bacterium]
MILLLPLLTCMAVVAWNVWRWPAVRGRGESGPASIAVLIPARNEEANIAGCLDSVTAQPGVAEILVYDDHSSDATREMVAARTRCDARIRLAETKTLPSGWCGKNFACWQLAAQSDSEWLLFLDADARLSPGAVAGMLAECRARSASFLSCWPKLEMRGFWEKLLMPMLNFVVFTVYPAPLSLKRPDASLGLAHGACILVSRDAYARVEGHAAVAAEIFEDTCLARLWRERGERSICLDGRPVVRVRMYDGVREIWLGFRKNFRSAFRTPFSFWLFLAMHAVFFLGPFLAGSPAALVILAARLLLALRFRHPLWSVLLHPFAECFLLALGISSWWAFRSGSGVEWKGRRYQHT